jgi:GH15 family glucan-1,4-alpha-glucosidase
VHSYPSTSPAWPNHIVARDSRRRNELGLSVLLAARRSLHGHRTGRHLNEWTAPWLSGYRWSTPVRIGNAAAQQKQIDVYRQPVDAIELVSLAGIERDSRGVAVEQAIVETSERVWREAGHGIWESRGEPGHYVYSQVIAWVAIDRFLRNKAAANRANEDWFRRMRALRAEILREVCQEGFGCRLNSFVQYYGGQDVVASLLLIASVGFLPGVRSALAIRSARSMRWRT